MNNDTMRVAVITDIRQVELREVPKPKAGPGEVLVKIQACGLCTWEQRTYTGVDHETKRPFAGGHEFAGVIEAIGENTKTDLKVGSRVSVGPQPFGKHNLDRFQMDYAGLWGPMGLAEYKAIPVGRAYKLAPTLPFEEGCFTEPLACAIHAADKFDVTLGDDLVVIGAGPMGMLNMLVNKRRGARLIVSDVDQNRCDYATELGADATVNPRNTDAPTRVRELTDGKGADVVIVAIGNHTANLDALKMVADFGTVMFFASAHPATDLAIDPNFIHRRQVTLTGARHPSVSGFETASALLSKRLINVRPLIHQTVPMDNIKDAFEMAVRPDTYRVIVTMA
ncbi:MAG: zinc-binding dehydrogenase [Chloroflexi bacterium]|nr:zinc-binding dehydrogenase [Chloroflexota bacterium]